MSKREILKTIAEQAGQGKLSFPTSTDVALRVMRTLDDPDCHIEVAARLVQAEPLLAARVVALANSVTFNRAGREISDIRQAVSRLGFRTLRALASAVVTRQMTGQQNDPASRKLAAQLWEHTAHVAALAHVLARQVTRLDPETALFAGIVHEVGGFYLLSRAKDFPELLVGDLSELRGEWANDVSRIVLKALAVPAPVMDAIEGMWQGYLSLPPVNMADTLLLADELSPINSPWLNAEEGGKSPDDNIDAVIGEDTLRGILAESAESVASLTGALRF